MTQTQTQTQTQSPPTDTLPLSEVIENNAGTTPKTDGFAMGFGDLTRIGYISAQLPRFLEGTK